MTGMVRLYHSSGAEVLLPMDETIQNATEQIDDYIRMGYLIEKPPKQHSSKIGWITYRSKIEDDGKETPKIDLYVDHPDMVYRILTVYLNNPDQISAFETACRKRLSQLPLSDSAAPLKRGDAKNNKYIVRLESPAEVFYTDNPYYNPDEQDATKKKPQYLFARWGQRIETGQPAELSFQWNEHAVKQLLTEAEKQGWSGDSVKLALGIQKRWGELTERFPTYDDAWRAIVDYLVPNQVTDLKF